ncbi:MAG: PIN domain-containing protein [Acidobacteriota bacterium]|nr:PIN domain-containing protein [Acidobacteriota bacterium]
MTSLVDTNVLVYAHDPLDPAKQKAAVTVLRDGLAREQLVLPHQAIVEFVSAVGRPRKDLGGAPLLERNVALLEAEDLIVRFPVLYPDEAVLRTSIWGTLTYQLSWYDAHLWAYAEVNGLDEILSEDFEHGRRYGSVRVRDPFLEAADEIHELPALYEAP